ncbi:hypothetical protein COCON_G00008130 [Conger conger]|uniref:Uncharacterized protein n=1 Tax=Conger conger TaxID=82655 RepID=A0A9Q1E227_CONCO|nr:hypothetical protein COCON_G00008130 [Conger conger]
MTIQLVCKSNEHKSQAQLKNPECEDSGMARMIKLSPVCCSVPRAGQCCQFLPEWLSGCWSFYHSKCAVKRKINRAQESQEFSLSEVSLSSGSHNANVRPVSHQPRDRSSSDASSTCGLTLPVESRKEMGPPPDNVVCLAKQNDPIRSQHIVEIAPAPWERDAVLRVELWDLGRDCGKPRYRMEWELSEGFTLLGTGVWLSRIVK